MPRRGASGDGSGQGVWTCRPQARPVAWSRPARPHGAAPEPPSRRALSWHQSSRVRASGMATGSFSHAIAEGDGISVVAAVEDADSARSAEAQRAEALVVTGNPAAVRDATSLPILWRGEIPFELASSAVDAVMIVFDGLDDDDGRLEQLHQRAVEL